ncbi:uncharacterized protein LOC119079973 [Bradysia coprophila]|uniref:uncharacterized protein LOC119079973 n=1 Tax=Bradysia coprophila TaxID=38358 RepID=UPI00187D9F1E|nr:uncharacterized protein LOC119079973 [Bradysia coprophila]
MKQFIICLAILFVASTVSAGPGCAWSGCGEFKGAADLLIGKCKSGLAAGSGRTERLKGKKCGFLNLGGKDFCCDRHCKYEECSYSCEELGKTSWKHEIAPIECKYLVDGRRWITSTQEFCCP